MSRSRAALLALPLAALLLAPVLSCKRGDLPGAPEGYNFRTAHIVWKLEGSYRGAMEQYIETSSFKDGVLHYKRYVTMGRYDVDGFHVGKGPRKVDMWLINDQNEQYFVMKPLRRVYKSRINLDQFLRMNKTLMWREILWGIVTRKDVSMAQREALKLKITNITDEDLKKVGAKITPDTFLGYKVKRIEIPLEGGQATLLMYGDIALKQDLKYRRFNQPFHKIMTATKFELNKPIPKSAATPPRGYKVLDSTKPIPAG